MSDPDHSPIPLEMTLLGVAITIGLGFAGTYLAVDAEEGFPLNDAWWPIGIGIVAGLVVSLAAIALYPKGGVTFVRAKYISTPVAAALGLLLLRAPRRVQAGAISALTAFLVCLVVAGGALTRRTSRRE